MKGVNMIKGLVTVVLPIYNVEKYLNRCVESVVNQTYSNIEILLIDDGSTDNCSRMCDEWAKKDGRIKVIHKENQGLGMARNTGIDNAEGEYICFFDSDDFIAPETVEEAYKKVVSDKADICQFGVNFADESGAVSDSFVSPLGYDLYSGEKLRNFFLPEFIAPDPKGSGERMFYMSPCLMLYSMELINKVNWRFVSERDIISEDVYSLLLLFRYVEKVTVIPAAYYFYCRNEQSLSRKYVPDRFEKIRNFYNETKALCERLGYDDEIIHRVSKPYLAFTISAMKQESVADRSQKENRQKLKELINDSTLQAVLRANKYDKVSTNRKILFFAIRNKMYSLCYLLLKMKA